MDVSIYGEELKHEHHLQPVVRSSFSDHRSFILGGCSHSTLDEAVNPLLKVSGLFVSISRF